MSRGKKILIGLGVIGFIGAFLPKSPGDQAPATPADSAAVRAKEEADSLRRADFDIRVNAKEAMRQRLKDPESAKFQNVTVHRYSGHAVACGEVNAKNGFGGYGGFEEFLYVGGVAMTRNDGEAAFVKSWNSSCVPPKVKAKP